MERKEFVQYDASDTTHFGASEVIQEELKYIRQRRGLPEKQTGNTSESPEEKKLRDELSGLALSGGGIRSASFGLGVMQALAHNGWLNKFDYLSTVSGGGYIGSSLSWLLSQKITHQTTPTGKPDITQFGVNKEDFPYGSYPMCGAQSEQRLAPDENEDSKQLEQGHTSERTKGKLLRYLRQQAKYLTPGDGITGLSLAAVLLRGALLSLFIYFGLIVLSFLSIFTILTHTPADLGLTLPLADLNLSLWVAIAFGITFIVMSFAYSIGAYIFSRKLKNAGTNYSTTKSAAYSQRQTFERIAGHMLGIIILFLVLGAVPLVDNALQEAFSSTTNTISDFEISGTKASDGSLQITGNIAAPTSETDEPSNFSTLIGALSTLFGALSGVMAFLKSGSGKKGRLPMGLVAAIGSAALWFGLLLIAYNISHKLWLAYSDYSYVCIWLVVAATIFIIGHFSNINYLSIHRYYRDRLMEAFMPDVDKALKGSIATRAVSKADKMPIHELCKQKDEAGQKAHPAPYHLINTNVVLESSLIPKFRGRGGDNFILSPYYCGSNATHWRRSDRFMGGRMTLPTAMAISGAAVNPSTGVGGQGATRQTLLSMLMGLLNIRLGYWTPNPTYPLPDKAVPNYFTPGLDEMLFRGNLNEKAEYVELTDGGHFENLALYELIRRRVRFIIVCDGAADPDFHFTDFANALEKIRTDFGTLIDCDCKKLQALVPKNRTDKNGEEVCGGIKTAEQGYLLSKIIYPDNSQGRLLYIKTTFFEKLSADLYGYKKSHPQ